MQSSKSSRSNVKKNRLLGIKSFSFNYFCIVCLRIVLATYYNGIARTLERRFGLRSRTLGIISSLNDVVIIFLVLFVGYLGKAVHIPRVISLCAFLLACSAICMTMPYFIYGPLEINTR